MGQQVSYVAQLVQRVASPVVRDAFATAARSVFPPSVRTKISQVVSRPRSRNLGSTSVTTLVTLRWRPAP